MFRTDLHILITHFPENREIFSDGYTFQMPEDTAQTLTARKTVQQV